MKMQNLFVPEPNQYPPACRHCLRVKHISECNPLIRVSTMETHRRKSKFVGDVFFCSKSCMLMYFSLEITGVLE